MLTEFWLEGLKGERDLSEDIGMYDKTILKWNLGKHCLQCRLDSCGSRQDRLLTFVNAE